ncbi:TonB-dependent siderophore receptor [Aquabacterium sp. CECT 9606]|uniref:TonB-dependent receptor n=1 Tax=Aquabacterium sp. CECT 9606 TaxID=2845822 RepID=UPI001E3AA8DA|nr:TonB-dependent siderophore receptor [Aquabacterium sp. CECT 9606]CAH0348010.1 putative TonB-dependent receptor BfrD [Aquabacterium sp. CECT 9606]
MSRPRTNSALPLGALAAGFGLSLMGLPVLAQTTDGAPKQADTALPEVTVKGTVDRTPPSKNSYQATTTTIGKGKQELRDIPQSVTVVTQKLMQDRSLTDIKDVLHTTAGVTFQAGETGEEDVRLRGFSLSQSGDIYIDGLRDPSLYERDTFNNDRIEVLRGSASMLFGRGSTGGVVNQVNKQPYLMTQHEVETTVGTGKMFRLTGDFNIQTSDTSALRINALVHEADNKGASVSKRGIAPTYRWGIGTADEFTASLYHLQYDNNPTYNHPWFLVNGKIVPSLQADHFYGLDSDHNKGNVTYGTLSHLHKFSSGGELKTTLRQGYYKRDLLASTIRFVPASNTVPATTPDNLNDSTVLQRNGSKGRMAATRGTLLQSDYNQTFKLGSMTDTLITGADLSWDKAARANNFANTATRPDTTVGTPDNGAWVPDLRGAVPYNHYTARNLGLYVQNTLAITPAFKLIAGLRNDQFSASYHTTTGASFARDDSLWSERLGVLFQPSESTSFHASYGTSFNVSGDTYQFAVQGPASKDANTAPEKSRNFEIGSKLNLLDQRLSLNTSLFYSEKYNERNTDPDSASAQQLLSGKRHAAGLDLDIAGKITKDWEAYLSYTWIPEAKIDKSNVPATTCNANTGVCSANNAQQQGDRPGLTPKHSASLWSTYQLNPQWRFGAGLNHRGSQNPEGNRAAKAADFTTADLMVEYTIDWRMSLRLNINNVTDELYADGLYRGFYTPGAARSAQLTLKTTF